MCEKRERIAYVKQNTKGGIEERSIGNERKKKHGRTL